MEKKVASIYNQAFSDISKSWDAYMKSHAPKVDKAHKDLLEAIKSGDKDAITEARETYEHTVKNVTVNNKRFQEMRDETAAKITHTNEVALNYVNNNMASVYTVNYNAFGDEKISGYSFSLVNEQAVKKLATTNKTLLPKKKLDIPKDLKWNEKLINSQLLQGILQGENITKMADRLQNVTNMNEISAIRNARTMTTAAENKGRQDSYLKASEDGVILKRIWVATDDDRTRAWHADLDGVEVDIDEPWVNEYGPIMEPGDPSADPANVYNCRCAMRVDVRGFRWNEQLEEDTEEEITHVVAKGKDISETWERRPDQFDFEIEDVINAQGFDGLPMVVPADEFDKYVKEANNGDGFIAQRIYSADSQEILDGYKEALYEGKWYVDCSTGGARFGQGMYTAGNYGYEPSKRTLAEMYDYENPNKVNRIETLTLVPDTKFVHYDDLLEEYKKDNKGLEDIGSYAVVKGYDVILARENEWGFYANILNRTKVVFKGE